MDGGTHERKLKQHEKSRVVKERNHQPASREGQAGRREMAERLVIALKPGNAGGAKGPQFKVSDRRSDSGGLTMSLTPPRKARKLQAALRG